MIDGMAEARVSFHIGERLGLELGLGLGLGLVAIKFNSLQSCYEAIFTKEMLKC